MIIAVTVVAATAAIALAQIITTELQEQTHVDEQILKRLDAHKAAVMTCRTSRSHLALTISVRYWRSFYVSNVTLFPFNYTQVCKYISKYLHRVLSSPLE